MMRSCWWCLKPFEASRPEQKYCTKSHGTKYRERERARAARKRCPRPGKLALNSERSARKEAARKELKYGDKTYVYLCPCGLWHLTLKKPVTNERAYTVLRNNARRMETIIHRARNQEEIHMEMSRQMHTMALIVW